MNGSGLSGTGHSASSAVGAASVGARPSSPNARSAARSAPLNLSAVRPPANPAIKWLAIGGWATFAVEWFLMLMILTTTVAGSGSRAGADAAPTPQAAAAPSAASTVRSPASSSVRNPVAAPAAPSPVNGPSVLGLAPGKGHTVILLDAIEKSRPWFDRAKAKLIAGLSRPGPAGATFSVAVINNNGGRGLINRAVEYGTPAVNPLRKTLPPLKVSGSKGLGDGLDAAIKLGAERVIFVTPRENGWSGALTFLEQKLSSGGKRIPLDVVQVSNLPVNDLRAFVTGANGGQYLVVSPGSI